MVQGVLVLVPSAPQELEAGRPSLTPLAAQGIVPRSALTFGHVYRTYFAHVSRWVRALGGPEAERDDLVQDVFVIVHRRLPDFDGENLQGWLYQITRRRVRDFRRLRWFRLLLRSSAVDESLSGSFVDARSPEGALGHKEQAKILERLLSKLPEAQRAAFVLFEIDGYTGEEIARLQAVPLNTVWARIHKARARLAADIARLQKRYETGGAG
jgi:RNA polymerase sigma-70 factor (ECF subfamily)